MQCRDRLRLISKRRPKASRRAFESVRALALLVPHRSGSLILMTSAVSFGEVLGPGAINTMPPTIQPSPGIMTAAPNQPRIASAESNL